MTRLLPARWYASALSAVRTGNTQAIEERVQWARQTPQASQLNEDEDYLAVLSEAARHGLLGSDELPDVGEAQISPPSESATNVRQAVDWLRGAQAIVFLVGAGL